MAVSNLYCELLICPECWILCKYIIDLIIPAPVFLSGSFVLVEVGELQSAMNVYIFAASTSGRCSTWVSTIHQAKVKINISVDPSVIQFVHSFGLEICIRNMLTVGCCWDRFVIQEDETCWLGDPRTIPLWHHMFSLIWRNTLTSTRCSRLAHNLVQPFMVQN